MIFAVFTIARMRIAARPPEMIPPIEIIEVKLTAPVKYAIIYRIIGIEITRNQERSLDILKSSLNESINAIDSDK